MSKENKQEEGFMEFGFRGICELVLRHKKGDTTSKHVSTSFNLDITDNLNRDSYFTDGLPNAYGTKVLSNVFVQGLIGNIAQANQNGYIDSETHLEIIIADLKKGLESDLQVTKSKFKQG
jgi:hypothetical protein